MAFLSKKIKDEESYKRFLRDYAAILEKVSDWEKEHNALYQEIMGAIDHEKMSKILERIQNIKDN